ncbi:hypothetical protein FLX35_00200 [Cylindrospermopsis raciborskii LB2897]|jgi:hypothetical protein|uniref:hypothetical protein n=2 Tax=Cylindrospermopsis raciborskii TaxID=77022 RepID=UPI001454BF4C|nr:hypothetical protein [Cylindrospermopsis raciborskii LB2897]
MNNISNLQFKRSGWQTTVIFTLGFWLSSSMVLDGLIMPSLYITGMMKEANFTMAGYTIFWNFNRVELVAAAVVLTAILAMGKAKSKWNLSCICWSCLLLMVALLDTYLLTPQMSALGSNLSLVVTAGTVPETMNLLHGGYFTLEVIKLVGAGWLFNRCWNDREMMAI